MENNIIQKIQNTIEYSINTVERPCGRTPKELRKMQYYVSYLIFTGLNLLKLTEQLNLEKKKSYFDTLRYMAQIGVIDDNTIGVHDKLPNRIKEGLELLFEQFKRLDIKGINVGEIYEKSLAYDIHVKDGILKYDVNKASRDRSGAYYTPMSFANKSVQRAVDLFIESNLGVRDFSKKVDELSEETINRVSELLSGTSIIDFSCGTGHFLLAFINYIKSNFYSDNEKVGDLVNKVIDNIWGIDVDSIAIQIVKTNLILEKRDLECLEKLGNQLIVGNPLIEIEEEYSKDVKVDTFASGILYSKYLGLNLNKRFLKNKDGFDLILGNPPWEKIRFEEKKFFSVYDVGIDKISQKKLRLIEIEKLKLSNRELYDYYEECNSSIDIAKNEIKDNSKLKLSLSGELNTYALFTELAVNSLSPVGEMCLILKSSIVTSTNNKSLFGNLIAKGFVSRIYEFINRKKIFAIDSRERFCVLYANKKNNKDFLVSMNLTEENDLVELEDLSILNKELINAINPTTNMLPNVSSDKELKFLIEISKKFNGFEKVFPNCNFGRLVHFTSHSDYIHKSSSAKYIPVYEGKFFEQYDGKYSTFEGVEYHDKYVGKASSVIINNRDKLKEVYPSARYYIEEKKWSDITKNYTETFSLMWRSLTSSTNTRITVATILPHMPTSQSVQLLQHKDKETLILILALFNSIIFDYIVKLKLNGIDLTQTIIKQIPTPNLNQFNKKIEFDGEEKEIKAHLIERVYLLLINDKRLSPLFNDLPYEFDPSKTEEKKKVMSEIDTIISRLYDINQNQLINIARGFKNFYSESEIEKYF